MSALRICSHGGYAPRLGCLCYECERMRREPGDDNQFAITLKGDRYRFNFHCPACNACGEMGVPMGMKQVQCGEQCGALFVLWRPPFRGSPALRCINLAAARQAIGAKLVHGWRAKGFKW